MQSRPHRQGQAKRQAQAKMRRLGPELPRDNPRTPAALTWIRSPGREAPPSSRRMRALDDDGAPCYDDDGAVENTQRGEQGRGAVALVIVRHGAEPDLLQRQA